MKHAAVLLALAATLAVTVADQAPIQIARVWASATDAAVDLAPSLRQSNWGGGSCVHASTVSVFNWLGAYDLGTFWRKSYRGGEYASRHAKRLDAAGIAYTMTTSGDAAFLDQALGNAGSARRMTLVTWGGRHMVDLVHLDPAGTPNARAAVLDNNRTSAYKWMTRSQFLSNWRRCGGWATVIIARRDKQTGQWVSLPPAPPVPRIPT